MLSSVPKAVLSRLRHQPIAVQIIAAVIALSLISILIQAFFAFLPVIALILVGLALLSLAYYQGDLPPWVGRIPFLLPILDWILATGAAASGGTAAKPAAAAPRPEVVAAEVTRLLRAAVVGQDEICGSLGELAEAHFSKARPTKPASVVLVGLHHSGKTLIGNRLAQVLGAPAPVSVPLSSDGAPDWSDFATIVKSHRPPVIVLDRLEAMSDLNATSSSGRSLEALLERGDIGGHVGVAAASILLITRTIEADAAARVEAAAAADREETIRALSGLPRHLMHQVDRAMACAPLSPGDRLAVLWGAVCGEIRTERGIEIRGEPTDDAIDLLADAVETWAKTPDVGFNAAKRKIKAVIEPALTQASRQKWTEIALIVDGRQVRSEPALAPSP